MYFNAVNDAIIFHWHLLHSSLSGGNKFLGFYTGKKKCVRDGSAGRIFCGCPGCYLGNIRVYPYNRDVAIIFLPTDYLLHTCILFTHTCTATTTGHLTWGVVF